MLGAGPAGLTAAYVLGAARPPGVRLRGGRHRRRHRQDGPVRGLPLRPRRSPVLHEAGRRAALGGVHGRGVPPGRASRASTTTASTSRIRSQARDVVKRLGISSRSCARSPTSGPLNFRREAPKTLRGLGDDALRPAAERHVLPLLHREGLGNPRPEIQSEWAVQRIKDFSFWRGVLSICTPARPVTTLIEEFHYPRLGPGQLWERMDDASRRGGSPSGSTTA